MAKKKPVTKSDFEPVSQPSEEEIPMSSNSPLNAADLASFLKGLSKEDAKTLTDALNSVEKEGTTLGKKVVRASLSVLGTAAVAGTVTFIMTRGVRRGVKDINTKLDNLTNAIATDNVVSMKTGTR